VSLRGSLLNVESVHVFLALSNEYFKCSMEVLTATSPALAVASLEIYQPLELGPHNPTRSPGTRPNCKRPAASLSA